MFARLRGMRIKTYTSGEKKEKEVLVELWQKKIGVCASAREVEISREGERK